MTPKLKKIIALCLTITLLSIVVFVVSPVYFAEPRQPSSAIPIAVLGDSDSHSYRDKFDNKARGGEYHDVTFNWPALWDRFRSDEVNLGRFDEWGESYRLARIKYWLGLPARAPKKLDFEYNYAVSGLRCESLLASWPYQAKWLIQRLQRSPEFWQKGIVIIRIGVNDLGSTEQLIRWSKTGLDEMASKTVSSCTKHISETIEAILTAHPTIKVTVMGMCRSCNLTDTYKVWPDIENIQNRDAVMSAYDQDLEGFASNQQRVLFIDDVQWLKQRYGDRYSETMSFETKLAEQVDIYSKAGDHPSNLILSDLHSGTVYNAFWLNNLIGQMNNGFDLRLTPINEKDVLSVIEPVL
ncbi:MAG: hypothetical protein ACMZ64_01605 [Oleiphilus sp.]